MLENRSDMRAHGRRGGVPPSRPARRPRKWLRRLEILLLLIGFAGVGVYLFSVTERTLYQSYETYRFEAQLDHQSPSWTGYARYLIRRGQGLWARESEPDAYQDLKPETEPPGPPQVPPSGLIGRIEIPRAQVSAMVREGVDAKTLRRSVGHVPGTALPGKTGNIGLAGHRDTFFRGLRDIGKSDLIRLETTSGTYQYVVESTSIVTPKDVEVLDDAAEPLLTLVTCYPFNYVGHAPKRFIVRARQADASEARLLEPPPPAPAAVSNSPEPPRATARKPAKRRVSMARKPPAPPPDLEQRGPAGDSEAELDIPRRSPVIRFFSAVGRKLSGRD